MIVPVRTPLLVRLAMALAWRSDRQIAARLESFAATEAGSALDMLRAAEITSDATIRRLFFRHALDEARHATLFRRAARALGAEALPPTEDGYELVHATRQNLLARYGLVRFLAFVHLAEREGAARFVALRARLSDRAELVDLFDRVIRDERFHIAYSRHLLDRLAAEGRAREVRLALLRVRFERLWEAWRRAGRVLGDAMSRGLLAALYLVVVPFFAWKARSVTRSLAGWHPPPPAPTTLDEARRQG
jgi:rubrerythrin